MRPSIEYIVKPGYCLKKTTTPDGTEFQEVGKLSSDLLKEELASVFYSQPTTNVTIRNG